MNDFVGPLSALTNENIHRMGGATDNHPNNDECRTGQSDVSAANEIRQTADEGANRGQRKQIAQDEPDPSICASDIGAAHAISAVIL